MERRTSGLFAALAFALVARTAAAQDDKPIPYPDDDKHELPRRSEPTYQDNEVPVEKEDREKLLGRFDDPNIGLAVEFLSGAMLIESSRGQGEDASFAYGARITWEYGRLIPDEIFHEALFLDLSWAYAGLADGTQQVQGNSNFHYFTLAPAFALPLGQKSFMSAYVQLGGGVAYQADALHVGDVDTTISGVKPLFQYGLGLRGRPALNEQGTVRLSFRVELTRFRRGYMDDLLLAASAGVDF
jgi:hypothetical protein